MIKYDYRCNNCEKKFTVETSYADSDKKPKCPECRSKDVRKVIQISSVHFKGSGFTKSIAPED